MPAREPIKVLYIVGVGRSGSTMLERMLGAIPGFVNTGELNALFSRVAAMDQRCGCGEPFSECPFWKSVGERAFGDWTEVSERIGALQPQVIRQRFIPFLLMPRAAPAEFRDHLAAYNEAYRTVYEALADVSGGQVLVDASKSAAQLFALRHIEGLDLRVLNLVRDSRGVAHSWSKSDIKMPQIRDREALMRTYPPHRLALMWSALQLESTALRGMATHSARMRYEDLVAEPENTLTEALSSLGLEPQPGWFDHVEDRSVTLGPSHGVAGSRSRFRNGRIELRLDDDWRASLGPRPRRIVTAMTLPQLVSHGYVGRPKGGS